MLTQVALKELRGVQKEISAANDFVIFASRDKWSFPGQLIVYWNDPCCDQSTQFVFKLILTQKLGWKIKNWDHLEFIQFQRHFGHHSVLKSKKIDILKCI